MCDEWEQKTVGDFLALQRGYDLTADEKEAGTIPVMGAAGHNGFHNEARATAPGIVVGRSGGSFGQVHFANEAFWPHNTAMFVTKFKGNDPLFAYYFLKNLNFDRLNSGSAQPSLNRNFVYPLKIQVPKPDEQRRVAKVLTALDAKIELNQRINAELEDLAKTIYDYWFVQFDFPDENGRPYKSSGGAMVWVDALKREIPAGWRLAKIADLLPVITGKEDANFATESGEYTFFTCADQPLRCDAYKFEGKSVLLAGNGNFGINIYDGKFNAYQRTYVLTANASENFGLVYFVVKDKVNRLRSGSRGSIVKFITKGDIENIELAIPRAGDLKLQSEVSRMLDLILKNRTQNNELVRLRDWLLPMLMNGQVRVK